MSSTRNLLLKLLLLNLCLLPSTRAEQQTPTQHKDAKASNVPSLSPTDHAFSAAQPNTENKSTETTKEAKGWPPPWDILYPTWGLVFVGGIASWAAIKTLKTIGRQTRFVGQQTIVLKRQARRLREQVEQMQEAGKQTTQLISHAEAHADAAQKAATAASSNAAAAKANTDALVNAERAWLMVDVEQVPGVGGSLFEGETIIKDYLEHTTSLPIRITCKNDGRTPAWIFEKRACIDVVDSLPEQPDWDSVEWQQVEPEPVRVGQEGKHVDVTLICKKRQDTGTMVVVYGIVRYRDAFGDNRWTSFGYRVFDFGQRLERLSGYSEYNKNA